MIVTQTPLRISFFGGGTDFREFFLQEDGWVVSSAIDRYVFVIVKRRFDDKIRVGYTQTELVDEVDQIKHELVRECLRKTRITKGVEVNTMADIPSAGSGMGSSSSVTVGLLNAMYAYVNEPKPSETLAREACEIEIDILGKPIGEQDQYIAAYGGQRFIHFKTDGSVGVSSLGLDESGLRRLNKNLMLVFTGITRKSETILSEQVENIQNGQFLTLRTMKALTKEAQQCLLDGDFDEFGRKLNTTWQLKKQLAECISTPLIEEIYEAAIKAGALGGKITGAGGGGFILFYCPSSRQESVRTSLRGLKELPFHLEPDGSKVIFNYRR